MNFRRSTAYGLHLWCKRDERKTSKFGRAKKKKTWLCKLIIQLHYKTVNWFIWYIYAKVTASRRDGYNVEEQKKKCVIKRRQFVCCHRNKIMEKLLPFPVVCFRMISKKFSFSHHLKWIWRLKNINCDAATFEFLFRCLRRHFSIFSLYAAPFNTFEDYYIKCTHIVCVSVFACLPNVSKSAPTTERK